jgi:hypothetical protein
MLIEILNRLRELLSEATTVEFKSNLEELSSQPADQDT